MIDFYVAKTWVSWSLIGAQLCTVGVAMGLQVMWRSPRDAFRYGGLQYGLVLTVTMLTIALPLVLLQLAIGQLSQQDAVGVWRAVPFFKGVGYMKLIISFLVSIYSSIYVSLMIIYFFHAISNSLPFADCEDLFIINTEFRSPLNASACLKQVFMASPFERPAYFINAVFILIFLWIMFPFIFYSSVKLMKRIIYVLGLVVIILTIVTVSFIGNRVNLSYFVKSGDWRNFFKPYIWHGAVVQALLTSQIAGGYLISVGNTVYSKTNVLWTSIMFVGVNILSTWAGLLFWYSVSLADKDISVFAVLIETYKIGEQAGTNVEWPILIFFILILSGFITLLTLLLPIFDHCRHIAGVRWRVLSTSGSLVSACVCVGFLVLRVPGLVLLDDYAVPLLVCISVFTEIIALVFIYDWRVLLADVEFLTGRKLAKCWALGWGATPCIIAPFTMWWLTMIYLNEDDWTEPPWAAAALTATVALAVTVFLILSITVVARQVQYDIIEKLKSSFKPSRQWGPRDPITHYYWMARRQEADIDNSNRNIYYRRQLRELTRRSSFLNVTHDISEHLNNLTTEKKRSNSDDWLYTIHKSQKNTEDLTKVGRSRSLDLNAPTNGNVTELKHTRFLISVMSSINNNDTVSRQNKIVS